MRRLAAAFLLVAGTGIGSLASEAGNSVPTAGIPPFVVEVADDYNRLFTRTNGWLAADVSFSFPLSDGRVFWLFGDTWVGKLNEQGHRVGRMIHNTVGLQEGLDPVSAKLSFFHGGASESPSDWIQPADGDGCLWLSNGGIQTGAGLYLFAEHMITRETFENNPVLGKWRAAGIVVAKVSNPREPPDRWQIAQASVPFLDEKDGARRSFGMPLCREGRWTYLYGLETGPGCADRFLLAARTGAEDLADFSRWEFYADGQWQGDFRKASRLCNHMGAELSVSYVPGVRKYALVYTHLGLSDRIELRMADSPVGPWSEARTVYHAPEPGWDKTYFCYAAKGHPELSKENELLISYACNSSDFDKARRDSRIYVPKFIRVVFDSGVPAVRERTTPDGLTAIDVFSHGRTNATYRLDLKTHHEPATEDAGRIRRWEQYRFGGFFCYNDNQFNGSEFSRSTDPKLYAPTNLNVAGWASAMKGAGMRYAVLTTRHTSGFLLWDSATTEFDVASSGDRTDVVGEFVKECRRAGIAPGFYYCLWGGSGWMPQPNARAMILAQLHELATGYGEIPYFWIDMGLWRPANLSPQEIYDSIRNVQPGAVVILNQHIQDGSGLRYFPTDIMNGEVHLPPERGHQPFRRVDGKRYYLPFEFEPVSQRIPKGTTTPWGNVGAWFTVRDSEPFPAKGLFDWIRQAYARGANNVLLSLAADHTGSMRPGDVRQLEELGTMLREAGLLDVPAPAALPPVSLAEGKPAKASGVWEDNVATYGAAAAFDGDPSTRWGGPVGSKSGWLEVDLGCPVTVSRAVIQEGWDRTRRFSVEYTDGDQWKAVSTGTTVGANLEIEFSPVEAQRFRLNIIEAIDVPTIWEFQLFATKK